MSLEQLPQGDLLDVQIYGAGEQARADRFASMLKEAMQEIDALKQQLIDKDRQLAESRRQAAEQLAEREHQAAEQLAERDKTIAEQKATIDQLQQELQAQCDARDPSKQQSTARRIIMTIDKEGLLKRGTQWYAIYRFLTEELGFPKAPLDFCTCIDLMELDVSLPCVHNNWRRVPSTCTNLARKARLWKDIDEEKSSGPERSQLVIMKRMYALLKAPPPPNSET